MLKRLTRRCCAGGLLAIGGLLAGTGRRAAAQGTAPAVPGAPATTKSRVLEAGAVLLQDREPLDAMNMYLDGFHFYADDMGRQVESHHYCAMLNEEVHQCAIFDGNGKGARLIGVEYIISERLFRELPEDEKALWHSHRYETTSGELVMPGIPGLAEREVMEKLSTTYGKTWHTWQVDRGDQLPLGPPRLMMAFLRDGQLDPRLVEDRDRRLEVSTAAKRQERAYIRPPEPVPGADAWQDGETVQVVLQGVPVQNRR